MTTDHTTGSQGPSLPEKFVADTGPLLCHGVLKQGARRMRNVLTEFIHVSAVKEELERQSRRNWPLKAGAEAWVGKNSGKLGSLHDLSGSEPEVQRIMARLAALDHAKGEATRHASANSGESEAIVASLESGAVLIANDNGARTVAAAEGTKPVWTTIHVLVAEIEAGTRTEHDAFEDYERMRTLDADPGAHLSGSLDLLKFKTST